jgi:outer membrane protein TolC
VLYHDTLIPQATQAADLAQTWYESGTNSFTDLIESRLVLENFQLAGTRAQADYLIALAELQRLTGAPIEGAGNANPESQEATQ